MHVTLEETKCSQETRQGLGDFVVKLSLRQGVLLTWFSGLIIKVTSSAGLQALILKWVLSG